MPLQYADPHPFSRVLQSLAMNICGVSKTPRSRFSSCQLITPDGFRQELIDLMKR